MQKFDIFMQLTMIKKHQIWQLLQSDNHIFGNITYYNIVSFEMLTHC